MHDSLISSEALYADLIECVYRYPFEFVRSKLATYPYHEHSCYFHIRIRHGDNSLYIRSTHYGYVDCDIIFGDKEHVDITLLDFLWDYESEIAKFDERVIDKFAISCNLL